MSEQENVFDFFISTSASFLVVTFLGEISARSLPRLQECEQNLMATSEKAKYFILYFRDVPNITIDAIPFLTTLQQNLRRKGELRLCSLRPEVKEKLVKSGVVRGGELSDNLQSTLQQLKAAK